MAEICAFHAKTPTLTSLDARTLRVRTIDFYRAHADELPSDRVDRLAYDCAGRRVSRWDPRLWAAANQWPDTPGNLSTVHSLSGQALFTESADAGWSAELLGDGGQRICRWDGAGHSQWVEYDQLLRAKAVFENDGAREHCTERLIYGGPDNASANQCGQLMRHDDPAGCVISSAFTLTGQVAGQTRCFLNELAGPDWPVLENERDSFLEPSAGATTCWRFNASGEAAEQADAVGNTQRFGHTASGQLKNTQQQLLSQSLQTVVSDIRYDARNRIVSETAGNGIVTTLDYDPIDDRLRNLRSDNGRLQDLHYRYDPVGNVVSIEDRAQPTRYFANQQIEPLRTFAYDTLYQLIEATGYESADENRGPAAQPFATADTLRNYTQCYEYDAGGNLQKLIHTGARNHTRVFATARYSNRSLLQIGDNPPTEEEIAASFDANGNLRELSPGQTLRWDLRNQLSGITPVERASGVNDREIYQYDAAGARVRKVRSTQTKMLTHLSEVRYLPGLEIRSNSATGELLYVVIANAGRSDVRVLNWKTGRPTDIENTQARYSLIDHLGSNTLELDQNGQLISHEVYYPYGETAWFATRSEIEAKYKAVRYSGKERDATGFYYYGLRYYAPCLMRWMSPDPAGDVDGPNRFAFVKGNPITAYDSKGTMLRWLNDLSDPPILKMDAEGYKVPYRSVDEILKAHETGLVFAVDTALSTAKELIEEELQSLENGNTQRLNEFLAMEPGAVIPESVVEGVKHGYQKIHHELSRYQHGGDLRSELNLVKPHSQTAVKAFAMVVPGDQKRRIFLTDLFQTRSVIANVSTLVHEISHIVMDTKDEFYYRKGNLAAEREPAEIKSELDTIAARAIARNLEHRNQRTFADFGYKTLELWTLGTADFWGHYLIARPLSDERHQEFHLYSTGQGRSSRRN
ncbi:RHS repeat-associated core domain-containing protein [Pseudomonas sp. RC10]|uniref:RHS repeat domain-containing protein n=1 Tax=Pseudomonas bambusae TaxID=3139142 RepID=UPI0031390C37